jgi:hypothetical protein
MYSHLASRTLIFLIVATAIVVAVPSARADIDPASDVLLNQNVYLPYEPKVCPQLERPLTKVADQAEKTGYPIKVAIIASEADLGGAAQYLYWPQPYAEFLGGELGVSSTHGTGLQTSRSLLTVMPNGFGYQRSGKAPDVSEVVNDLHAPKGKHPNDLARAAITALPKLAKAAGHSVPDPSISSGCSSGGGSSAVVYVVLIALLLIAAAIVGLVSRRRASTDIKPDQSAVK